MAGVHHFARDSARTPMQWDDSLNAGFTGGNGETSPWLPVHDDYKTVNVKTQMADPDSVLNYYIALSKLRRKHRELVAGGYRELFHEDLQIFAYVRENKDARAVVLVNLSTEPATYDASCVENANRIFGTGEDSPKGELAPLEAAVFEEIK